MELSRKQLEQIAREIDRQVTREPATRAQFGRIAMEACKKYGGLVEASEALKPPSEEEMKVAAQIEGIVPYSVRPFRALFANRLTKLSAKESTVLTFEQKLEKIANTPEWFDTPCARALRAEIAAKEQK